MYTYRSTDNNPNRVSYTWWNEMFFVGSWITTPLLPPPPTYVSPFLLTEDFAATEEWRKKDTSEQKEGGRNERWWTTSGDILEIREGQRDGVRYAVRLIGRGLLSHLSYSRLDRHLAHATGSSSMEGTGEKVGFSKISPRQSFLPLTWISRSKRNRRGTVRQPGILFENKCFRRDCLGWSKRESNAIKTDLNCNFEKRNSFEIKYRDQRKIASVINRL